MTDVDRCNWINNDGKAVKIAIIDSGIDVNRNEFLGISIKGLTLSNINGKICIQRDVFHDNIGHGTAATFIIYKSVPKAEYISIKIFDDEYETDSINLIAALEYIIENLDVDIIHLSNGVVRCDDYFKLYNVCKMIDDKGIIIIAAFDNGGSVSFPAAFDCVIGVDWYEKCSSGNQYIYVENSIVNIMGTGSLQRLPWKNDTYKYVAGSSFAAPYITAIASKLIQAGVRGREAILEELKLNAWKYASFNENTNETDKPDKIAKAILFPFNKEMHSLARFSDLLTFQIEGIYEPPLLRKVGLSVRDILKIDINEDFNIKSDKEIDWESDFDTVILGHTGVINAVMNRNYTKEFLDKCIKHKKNIYSFDDLSAYEKEICSIKENRCFAYSPGIKKEQIPKHLMGKLYSIHCPVLGVFGTSPKQGKYSLQISLRKMLVEKGYRVGQLGTEPSALLFGMDEVYPMGYEASVDVSGTDAISVVNMLMWNIAQKNPDIILIGSQSQTVPYSTGNIGLYPVAQHEFLLGTEPDACIICINPFDDITYIQRTIGYLESYIETKVIALCIFPLHREFDWAVQGTSFEKLNPKVLEERKGIYQMHFQIPCFILGDRENESMLLETCLNFFS